MKKIIKGHVDISNLYLDNLPDFFEGVEIEGYFKCTNNQLTTLKGAPLSVSSTFNCENNKLTSLEGAPRSVGGNFVCTNNDVKFTEEQVRAVCNVGGGVYV